MSISSAMKFRQLSTCVLLLSRSSTTTTTAFSPRTTLQGARSLASGHAFLWRSGGNTNPFTQRSMTSASGDGSDSMPPIRHVNKSEMQQILQEHEEMVNADLDSPYFVLDVRTQPEVQQTGQLSPSVPTLPVQVMMPPYNALQMDDEDFEEAFGFAKPPKDVIMVFTCAAGIRSVTACKLAQQAGYVQVVNYMGGSNEWFFS